MFYGCKNLNQNIFVPNKGMFDSAFYLCLNLTDITLAPNMNKSNMTSIIAVPTKRMNIWTDESSANAFMKNGVIGGASSPSYETMTNGYHWQNVYIYTNAFT